MLIYVKSRSHPEPVEQSLLSRETVLSPSIVIKTETHTDLIVEDEGPNKTKNQFQVPTYNITTTYGVCERGL